MLYNYNRSLVSTLEYTVCNLFRRNQTLFFILVCCTENNNNNNNKTEQPSNEFLVKILCKQFFVCLHEYTNVSVSESFVEGFFISSQSELPILSFANIYLHINNYYVFGYWATSITLYVVKLIGKNRFCNIISNLAGNIWKHKQAQAFPCFSSKFPEDLARMKQFNWGNKWTNSVLAIRKRVE